MLIDLEENILEKLGHFKETNQFPFTFKQAIFISTQRKRELMKVTNIKDFTEATTAGVVE